MWSSEIRETCQVWEGQLPFVSIPKGFFWIYLRIWTRAESQQCYFLMCLFSFPFFVLGKGGAWNGAGKYHSSSTTPQHARRTMRWSPSRHKYSFSLLASSPGQYNSNHFKPHALSHSNRIIYHNTPPFWVSLVPWQVTITKSPPRILQPLIWLWFLSLGSGSVAWVSLHNNA